VDDRVADLITSISEYMDEEVNGGIVDLKHMLLVALTGSSVFAPARASFDEETTRRPKRLWRSSRISRRGSEAVYS
jgi:hypothetical protein